MASAGTAENVSLPGRTVATFRADEEIDGVFACTRKERQISRAGAPYLTLELRDSTGTIVGRAFRDADLLAGRFERGDLVRVAGRVQRFREQLQLDVRTIAKAEGEGADPASFLPRAYRDVEELEGFLEHLAREVYDEQLSALLGALLADRSLRAELRRAPCSIPYVNAARPGGGSAGPGGHHAYLGGLLEHTVAVATLAVELCTVHQRLDRDLLLTAAIVHDLGKTREFVYGAEISRSPEGSMLGHIELGLRVLAEHLPAKLTDARRLALEHCVVCHHGADGLAGRRFASAEAVALYRLNALDAGVKGAIEHGIAQSAH